MARPVPLNDTIKRRMLATKRRDTKVEVRLRSLLHRRGLRFRVDLAPVAHMRSRADVVFPNVRVAVFVNGCFWHGCPAHGTWPKNNAAWWRAKIEANRDRDQRVDACLRAAGWEVIRVWEHEDLDGAAQRVESLVHDRDLRRSSHSRLRP